MISDVLAETAISNPPRVILAGETNLQERQRQLASVGPGQDVDGARYGDELMLRSADGLGAQHTGRLRQADRSGFRLKAVSGNNFYKYSPNSAAGFMRLLEPS